MDSSDSTPREGQVLFSNYFPFHGIDEEDLSVDLGESTSHSPSPPTEVEVYPSQPFLDLSPIIKDIEGKNPELLSKKEVRERIKSYVETMTTLGRNLLPPNKVLYAIYTKNTKHVANNMPPPIHKDLMSIIADSRLLTLAYRKIGKNQGSSTPGVHNKSADGMSLNQIQNLATKLKNGTFNWTPFKRVWIEKVGKPKDPLTGEVPKRPLGIPTFEDRLVQECIRMVLNAIYEPWFEIQNCNFGFRPYKSTQDALTKLYREGQYTTFAIEGDIKGAFDSVVPEVLMGFLQKRISDKKFLNLVERGFKCGLLDQGQYVDTLLGTPQGGMASPILFNIYMHEFDQFVTNLLQEELAKQFKPKPLPNAALTYKEVNKRVRTLQNRVRLYNKKMAEGLPTPAITEQLYQEAIEQLPELTRSRAEALKELKGPANSEKVRITFARYADDWIMLTNLSHTYCEKIKQRCADFLKNTLHLTLSPEKTFITNITGGASNAAKFLGYSIYRNDYKRYKKITITTGLPKPKSEYESTPFFRPNDEEIPSQHSKYALSNSNSINNPQQWYPPPDEEQEMEIFFNDPGSDYEDEDDIIELEEEPRDPNKPTEISVYRFRSSGAIKITIDKDRLCSRLALKRYATKNTFRPRERPELSVLTLQEIVQHYNSVMLGLGNYYYPLLTRKSHLTRYHYILYYSCLKTIATKLRISVAKIMKKFGYLDLSYPLGPQKKITGSRYRIVIKYVQDSKEQREVLLSYIELRARLSFILLNQKVTKGLNNITTDFLTNHKKYWRTQFKLTTCCTVCGSTQDLQSHHIRKLDRKHCVGFGQLMSQLQRKQIPLCKQCHNQVHAGKYNDLSLDDLHASLVAKSEGLIIQAHSWDNQAAKPEIKKKLVKWNKAQAYKFNDKDRVIACEYSTHCPQGAQNVPYSRNVFP